MRGKKKEHTHMKKSKLLPAVSASFTTPLFFIIVILPCPNHKLKP